MLNWFKQILSRKDNMSKESPTVFHITHYKAGSQWVYAVLSQAFQGKTIRPEENANHCTKVPIMPGMIYPCVYLTRKEFESIKMPMDIRMFILIRDLRDTLVSQYFSVKVSHKIMGPAMRDLRNSLNSKGLVEGLIYLMEKRLPVSANIQKSWIFSDHLILRYEDLIENEYYEFKRMFDYCGFDLDEAGRQKAVEINSFEKRTGRSRGEEDINSHHRKGIAGDWKNYFNDRLKDRFKEKYAQLLIDTGYEKDDSW